MKNMNNKHLRLLIVSIMLTPLAALANSDDSQYPATHFQPTIIFADEEAIAASISSVDNSSTSNAETSSFDSNYPAANFEPKILYVDASAVQPSTSGVTGEKSSFDENFPAANFEPKIIFP
ncbi:MAG: hypothetical protein KAG19_02180 [Methylococcales bacterium]|nr:hypothetical protein [Methylococcales bacterium]